MRLIADNRIAELANIDDKMMAELLSEMDSMTEFTGFTPEEVDKMIAETEAHKIVDDDFDVATVAYLDNGQVLVPDLKGGFKIVDIDSDEFEYAKKQIFGSISNFKKLVSRLKK